MPFGPRETVAREGADNRKVFAADKGPYYQDDFDPRFTGPRHEPLMFDGPRGQWRRYNSPNHQGQGQNVLFMDGHVAFEYQPTAGVDRDIAYTLMSDSWDGTYRNILHGYAPHFAPIPYPYAGEDSLGLGRFSSTDSLIYP